MLVYVAWSRDGELYESTNHVIGIYDSLEKAYMAGYENWQAEGGESYHGWKVETYEMNGAHVDDKNANWWAVVDGEGIKKFHPDIQVPGRKYKGAWLTVPFGV